MNVGKTKVLKCKAGSGTVEKSGKWPYCVCNKGVENNSILCIKWLAYEGRRPAVLGEEGENDDKIDVWCEYEGQDSIR